MTDHSDELELESILSEVEPINYNKRIGSRPKGSVHIDDSDSSEKEKPRTYIQWTRDGDIYFPAGKTVDRLTPGVYEIQTSPQGIYFEKIPVKTEGLLVFPDTNSKLICGEIEKFWNREHIFREYDLAHKRGILLWGPPGSGKSCTLQLIMADVIGRGGVVFKFSHPGVFEEGLRIFRRIQPDTPIVVTMEDIDSLIRNYCESDILNILDGVNHVDKVVFLATTNYVNELGARIVNRPSRFDKRFKIGMPGKETRRIYLDHIIGRNNVKRLNVDLDRWVEDTDGFSLAHLKELFVAVVILEDDYKQAIRTLSRMKERIDDRESEEKMGFKAQAKCISNGHAGYIN